MSQKRLTLQPTWHKAIMWSGNIKTKQQALRLSLAPKKYQESEKSATKNYFLMFGYTMKNIKENQI